VATAGVVAAASKAGSSASSKGSAVGVEIVLAGGAVPHEARRKAPSIKSDQKSNKRHFITLSSYDDFTAKRSIVVECADFIKRVEVLCK
jgi:hypothetical protein